VKQAGAFDSTVNANGDSPEDRNSRGEGEVTPAWKNLPVIAEERAEVSKAQDNIDSILKKRPQIQMLDHWADQPRPQRKTIPSPENTFSSDMDGYSDLDENGTGRQNPGNRPRVLFPTIWNRTGLLTARVIGTTSAPGAGLGFGYRAGGDFDSLTLTSTTRNYFLAAGGAVPRCLLVPRFTGPHLWASLGFVSASRGSRWAAANSFPLVPCRGGIIATSTSTTLTFETLNVFNSRVTTSILNAQ